MKIKKILFCLLILVALYVIWTQVLWFLINKWITNSKSDESMIKAEEIYLLPQEVLDNKWVQFTLNGINTRKIFIDTVETLSKELYLDSDLVMACVLAEQIRISTKWVRWNLKWLILNSTPKLLRSYNVSLGIWWIKLDTAYRVKKEAISYWYSKWPIDNMWKIWMIDTITSSWLADNDRLNAIYATFLVKNIVTRWQLSWYDISDKPWIVCTLYNFGNDIKKKPNANPKIWWAIIPINGKDYTYWAIWMWVYYHLKLNQ